MAIFKLRFWTLTKGDDMKVFKAEITPITRKLLFVTAAVYAAIILVISFDAKANDIEAVLTDLDAQQVEKLVVVPVKQDIQAETRKLAHGPDSPFKNSNIKRKLKNGKTQEFDGDKYKIVPRHQKRKPAPDFHDNRVSLLVGEGPAQQLIVDEDGARTGRDEFLGLQYMRTVKRTADYELHLLLQVQTNESGAAGIGVGF